MNMRFWIDVVGQRNTAPTTKGIRLNEFFFWGDKKDANLKRTNVSDLDARDKAFDQDSDFEYEKVDDTYPVRGSQSGHVYGVHHHPHDAEAHVHGLRHMRAAADKRRPRNIDWSAHLKY